MIGTHCHTMLKSDRGSMRGRYGQYENNVPMCPICPIRHGGCGQKVHKVQKGASGHWGIGGVPKSEMSKLRLTPKNEPKCDLPRQKSHIYCLRTLKSLFDPFLPFLPFVRFRSCDLRKRYDNHDYRSMVQIGHMGRISRKPHTHACAS